MNNQLLEDIEESKLDLEDEGDDKAIDLSPDSILDIYSYSTRDLVSKYINLVEIYNAETEEDEKATIRDLAELIEVELFKQGYEIESAFKD